MNESVNGTSFYRFPLQGTLAAFSWFYILTTLFSLIGNICIVLIIGILPKFRRPSNYLVSNLSIASVIYMISVITRRLENLYGLWEYDDDLCFFSIILHKFPIPLISITIMVVSWDRIRVVRNPLQTLTTRASLCWILGIWIFCILIIIPKGFTRHHDPSSMEPYQCKRALIWNNVPLTVIYGLLCLFCIHVLPAFILIKEMLKTFRRMKFLSSRLPDHLESHERRRMLLRNSCIYSTIFITSWLPYGIVRCIMDFPPNLISIQLYREIRTAWSFFRGVCYLHVAFNPILLFLLSHDLRYSMSSHA